MQKTLCFFLFALVLSQATLSRNRFSARKAEQSLKTGTLSAGAVSSGSFLLSASIPSSNTAVSYQFLEGSTVLKTVTIAANNANAQTVSYQVAGKAAGTYTYYFVLWDNSCVSALSNAVSVTVPAATASTSTSTTTTGSTTTSSAAAWAAGVAYKAGDIVSYNGKNYKCTIAHTAIVSWEPTNAFTLWSPL